MSAEVFKPAAESVEPARIRLLHALNEYWTQLAQENPVTAGAMAFRPAREAAELRRLIRGAGGGLPAEAIARMWRSLCGDALVARGLTAVFVAGGDAAQSLEGARSYFGFAPAITPVIEIREALERAEKTVGVLACLPWPEHAGAGQWWPMLNENRFKELAIVAGSPAVSGVGPRMAIVGKLTPEASGEDDMLATAHDDTHSAERWLAEAGIPGDVVARARSLILIRFNEFIAPDDRRLEFARKAGLDGLRIVGVRPRP